MMLDKYQLSSDAASMTFEFISEGPKGKIVKVVQYSETNLKDLYNLGFGDKDLATGEIDDTTITNNGDSLQVLATVAATVYAFTDKHPKAMVYARAASKARQRLYRMGINNYLTEIQKDFQIHGMKDGVWRHFKRGTDYEAFLVKRK
jgi:hypothetical protein